MLDLHKILSSNREMLFVLDQQQVQAKQMKELGVTQLEPSTQKQPNEITTVSCR
jgi:hypothetical protein